MLDQPNYEFLDVNLHTESTSLVTDICTPESWQRTRETQNDQYLVLIGLDAQCTQT
jgi:hypothetical protein